MAKHVLASKFLLVIVLAGAVAAAFPAALARPGTAHAAGCGDPPADYPFTTSPAATNFQLSGTVPFTLTVSVVGGVLVFPSGFVSATFDWGDGSPQIPIAASPCDGDTAYWPAQTFGPHTYTTATTDMPARAFMPGAQVTILGKTYPLPAVILTLTGAAPTAAPTPTPAPAATPTPAPTAAPTIATAAPTQPAATVPAAAGAAQATAPLSSPTPSPSPSQSPSPAHTPSSTPSPTPTQPPASATAVAAIVATASPPPPPTPGIQVIEALKAPDEISTDPAVVATNIALAGVTVWVLFSSVMLNQVLQNNRDEIDRRTARLAAPIKRLGRGLSNATQARPGGSWAASARSAALVLGFTGLVYSVLDPGFGLNRATLTLFVSVVLGIGVVTYVYSGLEAAMTRRLAGAPAAVRPYPAAIGIAVVSVVISRVLDFRPGVMYGFIASCALLAPAEPDRRTAGRIAASPTTVILALSVVAWLLVQPLRSWYGSSGSWLAEVLEAAAVVIFVGGIESLFISMLPIAGMDGAKIFGWSKVAWGTFAILAAFLAWHVLLGRDQAYFSGLRKAQDVTVLALFVVYTALTLGIWAYFRFRRPAGTAAREPASIGAGGSQSPGG